MVGNAIQTPWTSEQVAQRLGCCRGNTSRKVDALGRWLLVVVVPGVSHLRADRAARSVTERLAALGQLAVADPAGFKKFIRDLILLGKVEKDSRQPNRR